MRNIEGTPCRQDGTLQALLALAQAAAQDMADNGKLDSEQLTKMQTLFPKWKKGESYAEGSVVRHGGKLYRAEGSVSGTKKPEGNTKWKNI